MNSTTYTERERERERERRSRNLQKRFTLLECKLQDPFEKNDCSHSASLLYTMYVIYDMNKVVD